MKKMFPFAALTLLVLGGGAWLAWPQGALVLPTAAVQPAVAAIETPVIPAPVAREPVVAPIAATPHEQRVRCIDERGAPIVGAEVRLLRMPYGSGVPDLVATSDASGVATFADVQPAYYLARARLGTRHHVPDVEHDGANLPGAPFDVVLEPLWVGGLELPGVEGIQQIGRAHV